jgi:phosphoribulokinase
VTRTFSNIFRREGVNAAIIEGDSFHRFDRKEMKVRQAQAEQEGNKNFSHFGSDNNLFGDIENLFRTYGETGQGQARKYLHNAEEAAPYSQEPCTARWSRPSTTSPNTPTCAWAWCPSSTWSGFRNSGATSTSAATAPRR